MTDSNLNLYDTKGRPHVYDGNTWSVSPESNNVKSSTSDFAASDIHLLHPSHLEQKEAETLSQEEITDIQRSIQEKSKDLEFIVGKIQTKQNETADKVFRDLNPSVQKILQELIAAKQVKILLGRENVLFADPSLDLTDDVTSMLDVAAQSE